MEKVEKTYSHSKLWLFESCPEFYKIKYIDRRLPEFPKSVELFLGGVVHEALEWLYKNDERHKTDLDDLLKFFSICWTEKMSKDVRFRNGSNEEYFNKGIKFLIDYFMRHKPFEENTLFIEKKILFPIDEQKEYYIQGFIDRVVKKDDKTYEVHDYKTNSYIKTKEQVDSDRQLAFYHLGLKEIFGENIDVKLIWHFLAHDKQIYSERTEEQLEALKEETLSLIKKIENNTSWPACGKPWCDWCDYKRKNSLMKFE